jgi:hypothetical protein
MPGFCFTHPGNSSFDFDRSRAAAGTATLISAMLITKSSPDDSFKMFIPLTQGFNGAMPKVSTLHLWVFASELSYE